MFNLRFSPWPLHYIIVVILCSIACKDKPVIIATDASFLPYDLESPAQTIDVPALLNEISGLTWSVTDQKLWAIEDENGLLYRIDPANSSAIDTTRFGGTGDYEGIELVGDTMFVLKSDGELRRIRDFLSADPKKKTYSTTLKKEDNCEGLGFDPVRKQLLIACKGDATGSNHRQIYAFDLATETLLPTPVYTIRMADIQIFLRNNNRSGKAYDDWLNGNVLAFDCSSVAIHPQTGLVYVLCSTQKALLALQPVSGAIVHFSLLEGSLHHQPEGLAFAPDGTMYISNEDKTGGGKIFKYAPE